MNRDTTIVSNSVSPSKISPEMKDCPRRYYFKNPSLPHERLIACNNRKISSFLRLFVRSFVCVHRARSYFTRDKHAIIQSGDKYSLTESNGYHCPRTCGANACDAFWMESRLTSRSSAHIAIPRIPISRSEKFPQDRLGFGLDSTIIHTVGARIDRIIPGQRVSVTRSYSFDVISRLRCYY